MKKSIGTTPDPELAIPSDHVEKPNGEQDKAQKPASPPNGTRPKTGAVDVSIPPAPSEGVTEEQREKAGGNQ